jgi:hypothetical protein
MGNQAVIIANYKCPGLGGVDQYFHRDTDEKTVISVE